MLKKTIAKRIQNPFRKRKIFTASAWLNWPSKAMVTPNTHATRLPSHHAIWQRLCTTNCVPEGEKKMYTLFFPPFFFF